MQYSATVTSKRQITIPSPVYRALGLSKGRKIVITLDDHGARIESMVDLVEKLAGSVTPPASFQGLTPDEVVAKAKKLYVRKHTSA